MSDWEPPTPSGPPPPPASHDALRVLPSGADTNGSQKQLFVRISLGVLGAVIGLGILASIVSSDDASITTRDSTSPSTVEVAVDGEATAAPPPTTAPAVVVAPAAGLPPTTIAATLPTTTIVSAMPPTTIAATLPPTTIVVTLPSTSPPPTTTPPSTPIQATWAVAGITDGDTLDVTGPEGTWTVRIIGINTPERDECFADEATAALTALAAGELVLIRDVSDTDQFDRKLRYVETVDGTDVGGELIRGGFAIARRYDPDTARASIYDRLQAEAEAAGVGLWASDACGPAT